jgi:hypothetical protein
MCLVWNGLLNNLGCYRLRVLLGCMGKGVGRDLDPLGARGDQGQGKPSHCKWGPRSEETIAKHNKLP